MREALRDIGTPDHPALAYDAWAPVGQDGKLPDGDRDPWLDSIEGLRAPDDYRHAFDRWRATFDQERGDRTFELELAGRLLVGHGNASATDVGLTLHHTWGVPILPGSAIKGILAHYVEATYGPSDPSRPIWEQSGNERERANFQGVTWKCKKSRRIQRGPGPMFSALFGAPDAEEDDRARAQGLDAGATAGSVVFHDALYVPESAMVDLPNGSRGERPLAADVLTVHHRDYYDSSGESPPNDFDRPNPVAFLTVRPGARLLFALSGPADWTALAEELLVAALQEWGAGGKTATGYGRFERPGAGPAARPTSPQHTRGERVTVTRVEDPKGKGKVKFQADDGFLGHFAGESPPETAIGDKIQVWVANVSPNAYTFILKQPKARGRK